MAFSIKNALQKGKYQCLPAVFTSPDDTCRSEQQKMEMERKKKTERLANIICIIQAIESEGERSERRED